MKTFFKKLKKYYFEMSRFASRVLVVTVVSALTSYTAALVLLLFGDAVTSESLAQYAATRLANLGHAVTLAGLLLCVLSDVIIKYDELEEDNT